MNKPDDVPGAFRKAKIVATVGPISASPDMLRRLFLAGVDVFRMNFSHGERADHAAVHQAIRALEREYNRPIAVLQDLQGPKIRIGALSGERRIAAGEMLSFVPCAMAAAGDIPLPHQEVFDAVAPGHDLLIDNGRIRVRVEAVRSGSFTARVVTGGVLRDRKGVNLPGSTLAISPLTKKDREDIAFGLELGVDWIALSFVQSPSDITEARTLVGDRAALVAKIEKPAALTCISGIVQLSDAVMIARGDLGVEIPHEDVPAWQKEIIQQCRIAMKPVIVATQMLDSMVSAPTPTRAEASDVATAIYDGADAVMLSAESATGKHPVEAVAMMDRIIRKTEAHRFYRPIVTATEPSVEWIPSQAIAESAAEIADRLGAVVIAAFSYSGMTAARIARWRPMAPVVALTPRETVARRLCLLWGAHSIFSAEVGSYEEMVQRATETTIHEGFASAKQQILIVGGIPFGKAGTTNNLRIVQIDPRLGAPAYHEFEI
jgi:pyruvate kinase